MRVTTRFLDRPAALVPLLPDRAPASLVSWLRDGEGMVGWGAAVRGEFSGPGRFAEAQAWWADLVGSLEVDDGVRMPGTGPLAFGTFAFADGSASTSVLVLPEVVVGAHGHEAWITTVDDAVVRLRDQVPHSLPRVRWRDGAVPAAGWPGVVAEAVSLLREPGLDKVVLARQVLAELDGDLDLRAALARLDHAYPDAWTYAVDGTFGATPELLVSRLRGEVRSRVLAGTVPHDGTDAGLGAAAAALTTDPKLADEHRVAAESVAHALGIGEPPEPYVLPQRAFSHLATDLSAPARGNLTSLDLAARLHPSAAVGGRPTETALGVIERLERADRGRYAGPVGWMDASGDGEWGIALRGGEMLGERVVRVCVGGGIMPGSDPQAELAETEAKLAPMRTALGEGETAWT